MVPCTRHRVCPVSGHRKSSWLFCLNHVYSFKKAVYFFGARTALTVQTSERRLAVADEASEYAIRGRRPETPRSLTITSGTPRGSRDVHSDGNHCDKKRRATGTRKAEGTTKPHYDLDERSKTTSSAKISRRNTAALCQAMAAFIWPHIYF